MKDINNLSALEKEIFYFISSKIFRKSYIYKKEYIKVSLNEIKAALNETLLKGHNNNYLIELFYNVANVTFTKIIKIDGENHKTFKRVFDFSIKVNDEDEFDFDNILIRFTNDYIFKDFNEKIVE